MKKIIQKLLLILCVFCTCAATLVMIKNEHFSISRTIMSKVINLTNTNDSEEMQQDESTEKVFVPYHVGYTLLKSGRLKEFEDKKRVISEKMYVEPNSIYYFKNLSAKYGNTLYVIYDKDNKVITYLGTDADSKGEVIKSKRVVMPENAAYFRLACDLNVNDEMFALEKVKEKIEEEEKENPPEENKESGTSKEEPSDGDNKPSEEKPTENTEEKPETKKDKRTISSLESLENIPVSYHEGYTLLKNGKLKEFDDKKRIISDKIYVEPNSIYYFENLSARYGNAFYVIYDKDNKVISYLSTSSESKGEIIKSIRVIMPNKAKYFRIAYDKNVNGDKFSVKKSTAQASLNEITGEPAIISFIDDDCKDGTKVEDTQIISTITCEDGTQISQRKNLYTTIEKLGIPYSLACPLNNIGKVTDKAKYITMCELKHYNKNGVNVLSHHLTEESMIKDYTSFDHYKNETIQVINGFKNHGIELKGIAYPNGQVNPNYMSIVKENYDLGFTVDRDINTLPYESHYIHRYELFPTNGIYDLEYAKDKVDYVAENGGWLVFMTHNWYPSFSLDDLEELVKYIRETKKLPIVGVDTVIDNYSNPIEMGIIKKSFKDEAEDFFVVDALGRISTNNPSMKKIESNNMKVYDKSPYKWEEVTIDYNTTSTIGADGYLQTDYEWDKLEQLEIEKKLYYKRLNVSLFIPVKPGEKYKLANLSANKGNCFYAFYDEEYNALSQKGISSDETGLILVEKIVTVPEGAKYIRIANDLNIYKDLKLDWKWFKLYRATNIKEMSESTIEDTTSDSSHNSEGTVTNNTTSSNNEDTIKNIKGDLNNDKKLTNDDLSILYLYINGVCEFTDEELEIADVNNDGKVNNKDWNTLQSTIDKTN